MKLFTIGFTQKSAQTFFELLKKNRVELLLDIRLNNRSQLAGFAKGDDLRYFLREICGCEYQYHPEYAPTKELLDGYRRKEIPWARYEIEYNALLRQRGDYLRFPEMFAAHENICLLCSEPEPAHCHRRLAAEMIASNGGVEVVHL